MGFSHEGDYVKAESFSVIILMEENLLMECWQKAIIKGTHTWRITFYFKTKLILADTQLIIHFTTTNVWVYNVFYANLLISVECVCARLILV